MITEDSVIDQITADEHGNVSVRRALRVLRDGVVIATTYHRHVVDHDADLSGEDPRVRAIATAARKDVRPPPSHPR